ncbi:MAG: DUF6159 family protein [Solirubrobacterales bacterium]
MSRIRQGWELTKKSWALLRSNRQLFRFPIYGAMASLAVVVVLVGPGLYLIDDGQRVVGGLITAIGLYGSSFIAIYFGVALAATADAIFHGREATISDGFALARERLPAIAGWAALAALVGVIISLLEQGGSIGEVIAASLVGAAWSLITFMAVPVITFEATGPWTTLKRSATLFKDRWAGQVTGNVAIGGIVFLVGVLPAILLIGVGVYAWSSNDGGSSLAGGAVIVALGVALLAVSMLVVQALRGVFGVALYRFATSGEVSEGYTEAELESAVRQRGSR